MTGWLLPGHRDRVRSDRHDDVELHQRPDPRRHHHHHGPAVRALSYAALGRALLEAGAVPRGLSAAGIELEREQHPLDAVALANELLALWDRPLIIRTTIKGSLRPS